MLLKASITNSKVHETTRKDNKQACAVRVGKATRPHRGREIAGPLGPREGPVQVPKRRPVHKDLEHVQGYLLI